MSAELRRLIQEQISTDAQMAGLLAPYGDSAAVFYQKAPSDSRGGWGKPRYPRIDFNVDMRHDPERKTAGTLTIKIWCTTECPYTGLYTHKEIESRIMELITCTLYTGSDQATVCAEWERSDEFIYQGGALHNTHPEVNGLTVTFEFMEFPGQITTSPDPIQGLNQWTKHHFGKMMAIGFDQMPPIWKPTDENPAIYWRFEGTACTSRQSYAVTWYTGTFAAHVLAGSVTERNKWIKAVIERMQIDGEVILSDASPMFINRITIQHNADPLRDGQLQLTGQYGVLAQLQKEQAQMKFM